MCEKYDYMGLLSQIQVYVAIVSMLLKHKRWEHHTC